MCVRWCLCSSCAICGSVPGPARTCTLYVWLPPTTCPDGYATPEKCLLRAEGDRVQSADCGVRATATGGLTLNIKNLNDDKCTPTKHLTPPPPSPPQQPTRSGSHQHGDTPAAPKKRRVRPVDGPSQPILPIVGPSKLAPEGGPGPGARGPGDSPKARGRTLLKQSFKNPHKSSCQVWGGCLLQSNGIAP